MLSTEQNIIQMIARLWAHINPNRRRQFGYLLLLMIVSSFLEIISIGAVLPFIAILTDPTKVFLHPSAQPIIKIWEITTPNQLLLPITIIFAVSALLASAMRLLLLWGNIRISYSTGADLGINIYRRTLYQPYEIHVSRNSSEVINGIHGKSSIAINVINMSLNIIGSSIMLVSILCALLSINALIASIAFGGFGLIYLAIIGLTRKRLLNNSKVQSQESSKVIKSLQEGLGGIRDVLIDGSQATYCKIYSKADQSLRRVEGNSSFISSSPRSIVEALGMMLIAMLAYSLVQNSDETHNALPILGALALGAQRLLPALQQIYGAWSNIQASHTALRDTLDLLEQPLPNNYLDTEVVPIAFKKSINLKKISFRYGENKTWIIKDLDLIIEKGSRIGLIGITGSGKSTILDIIMGLLKPTTGILEIDGQVINKENNREWQAHVAHVPQTIFLADTSVEENIAFGVPQEEIDILRVKQAAHKAQIANTIESWPKGYKTKVGERGIKLSGGQRQRIGIARALYKNADVLIFDEATSALDNKTESAVMQAIEELDEEITLLIIAHRLTTLKNCSKILEFGEGGIKRVGNYKEIIEN